MIRVHCLHRVSLLMGVAVYKSTNVVLSVGERKTLESWSRAATTEQRFAQRARFILAAADGLGTNEIAREFGVMPTTVSKWRMRFAQHGLEGLEDAPRPGRPRVYDEEKHKEVLRLLDEDPPPGYALWTAPLLAERLGGVSVDLVWRVLRQHGVTLQRRHSWCVSTDPQFAVKAADVVGLYLDPPENAVVLCIDEKPHIQALERAQGWLRLPDGRAMRGFGHEYKRHGTTTLFAALNVATGAVKAGHYRRRRRVEFLDFMNDVIAEYPDREIHAILDNLSTHKPKRDMWLARHPNVHFHFIPTHASWLNMIEVWFSILTRSALRGASFTHVREVIAAINAFVEAHNHKAAPFRWTKANVRQGQLSQCYTDLRQ
jgi:transposase